MTAKFGKKATFRRPNAIKVCFQGVTDRSGHIAMNVDFSNNPDVNSWHGKETFQLTIDEMSVFVAYFLGFEEDATFAYHGSNHNRSLTIKTKKDKGKPKYHQVCLFEAGKGLHYINLAHSEGFRVFNLLLDQLQAHYEQPRTEIIQLLKAYYGQE